MKELFQVVTLDEARDLILKNISFPKATEYIDITHALGRRLAGDLFSALPVPGFDRSTVDGFAVRAKDTFGVSESLPGLMTVIGEVHMGAAADILLQPGTAAAIPTGGMLPPGADAVVMVEYTERLDGTTIEVSRTAAPGDNVLREGEDVAAGSVVLPRDREIGPFEMGLAAAAGYDTVEVLRKLRVGVISTGEELVSPGIVPQKGQVSDINSYCLAGLIQANGGIPSIYGIIRDDKAQLQATLDRAVAENDLVVISGGSSVGVRDLTLDVLEQGLLFHGLAIRPGKPTLAAKINCKLVVGLPGHPASAAISFYLLVQPLLKWGSYEKKGRSVWVVLNRNLSSGPGREDYVRVKLIPGDNDYIASPVLGKSGLISTLAEADGILKIPLYKEGLSAGERVEVMLL